MFLVRYIGLIAMSSFVQWGTEIISNDYPRPIPSILIIAFNNVPRLLSWVHFSTTDLSHYDYTYEQEIFPLTFIITEWAYFTHPHALIKQSAE